MMPDDPPPQPWQEEVEEIVVGSQRTAAHADLGVSIRAHFDSLIAAGFSRPEALHLTGGYQAALIMAANQHRPHDG